MSTETHSPPGDEISSLTIYNDRIFLVAGAMVYELLDDGMWHPMVFSPQAMRVEYPPDRARDLGRQEIPYPPAPQEK